MEKKRMIQIGVGASLITIIIMGLIFWGVTRVNDSKLDGTWTNSHAKLVVDGKDAVLTYTGIGEIGTVDRKDDVIKLKTTTGYETAHYKILKNSISLTMDDTTILLDKAGDEAKTTNTKASKEIKKAKSISDKETKAESKAKVASKKAKAANQAAYEDYSGNLDSGEYEVGTSVDADIPVGKYEVEMYYMDGDADPDNNDGGGTMKVISTAGNREYEFKDNLTEKRVILRKGDVVTFDSPGKSTTFSVSPVEDYE